MQTAFPGRYTGRVNQATALFLIGMRVNTLRGALLAPRLVTAMTSMQHYLTTTPEAGYLWGANWFGRTTMLFSYWRNAEDVQRFASNAEAPHLEPWRRFVRDVGDSKEIGVWHELFTLTAGNYESVYVNMPAFGLGAAGTHQRVGDGLRTSRQRMAAAAERQ